MKTQEILSIVALSLLGLCFLCGLAKMAMKKDSDKKNCDKACSMAIFAAVVLVGVSQLLTETEKYTLVGVSQLLTETEKYTCQSVGLSPNRNFCGDEGGGSMPTCADGVSGACPPPDQPTIGKKCPTDEFNFNSAKLKFYPYLHFK